MSKQLREFSKKDRPSIESTADDRSGKLECAPCVRGYEAEKQPQSPADSAVDDRFIMTTQPDADV